MKRTDRIDFRCTPEFKEDLKKAAAVLGIGITELICGVLAGDRLAEIIAEGSRKDTD